MADGKADNRNLITKDVLKTLSTLADQALAVQISKQNDLPPKLAAIREKIDSGYYDSSQFSQNFAGKLAKKLLDDENREE